MHDAEGVLPLEEVAQLVGVSRQTLYRWRAEVSDRGNPLQEQDAVVREIVPPSEVFTGRGPAAPNLRQAIAMAYMKAPLDTTWRPAELIDELDRLGWLPSARSASQMVRNRIRSMVERGELRQEKDGRYRLDPAIRNTGLMPPEDVRAIDRSR
jgi:transposase-like protein